MGKNKKNLKLERKKLKKKNFGFRKKKFRSRYRYRNWTLVSVPDTETSFRFHTTCIPVRDSTVFVFRFFFVCEKILLHCGRGMVGFSVC